LAVALNVLAGHVEHTRSDVAVGNVDANFPAGQSVQALQPAGVPSELYCPVAQALHSEILSCATQNMPQLDAFSTVTRSGPQSSRTTPLHVPSPGCLSRHSSMTGRHAPSAEVRVSQRSVVAQESYVSQNPP